MVQLWQDTDPGQNAVDLVAADEVPEAGWKQVLEGEDENGRSIALIHEDSSALRRIAVFDAVVNNADRKGDHIRAMADRHRYGVDHGLTFHCDHKLRTVLWGWIGETLSAEELDGVDRVLSGLEGELGRKLDKLLTAEEIASLAARCVRLRLTGQRGAFVACVSSMAMGPRGTGVMSGGVGGETGTPTALYGNTSLAVPPRGTESRDVRHVQLTHFPVNIFGGRKNQKLTTLPPSFSLSCVASGELMTQFWPTNQELPITVVLSCSFNSLLLCISWLISLLERYVESTAFDEHSADSAASLTLLVWLNSGHDPPAPTKASLSSATVP